MDKYLFDAFQKLTDIGVSDALHVATYRKVVFWRYRKYIIIATSLVAITFLFSLWHVYTRMMEAQTISTIKALLGSFELSLDSITDSLETAFDFLPIQSIVLSTLNLITLVFAIFFFHTFSKLQSRLEIERSTSTN